MSDPESQPSPNDLDAYLDGLLSPAEREKFARRLATDLSLRAELELQRKIDRELRRQFQPPPVPSLDVAHSAAETSLEALQANGKHHRLPDPPAADVSQLKSPAGIGPRKGPWPLKSSPLATASLILVATLAWILVFWNLRPGAPHRVVFKERPLAEVYQETIAYGFEPYYVCEEEERFRSTFYYRHGAALKLGELPPGREMVGLSYPPSISRHSTAMLARVDGEEVMVFVDKLSRDRPIEPPPPESGLRMFRRELQGLVMYEVTPLDEPRMMDFLLPADPPADACATE
jgi:hypothetical protein